MWTQASILCWRIVMTQEEREQHLKKNRDTKEDIDKTVGLPSGRTKERAEKVMQSQTLQRILEIKAETSEVEREFKYMQVEFVSSIGCPAAGLVWCKFMLSYVSFKNHTPASKSSATIQEEYASRLERCKEHRAEIEGKQVYWMERKES